MLLFLTEFRSVFAGIRVFCTDCLSIAIFDMVLWNRWIVIGTETQMPSNNDLNIIPNAQVRDYLDSVVQSTTRCRLKQRVRSVLEYRHIQLTNPKKGEKHIMDSTADHITFILYKLLLLINKVIYFIICLAKQQSLVECFETSF